MRIFFNSFLISSLIIFFSFFITQFWNTNDDVGTLMAVTGFGGFYQTTEFLQYSNNIYGILIKNFPDLFGYNRYVWVVLIEIFLSTFIIILIILQKNFIDKLIKFSIILFCVLFIIKIALFPQFTIVSGLLFISGFLLYTKFNFTLSVTWPRFIGLFLIFLSSLVRFEMFLFLLFIFFPYLFLDKKNIFRVGFFIITLILILSINLWSKSKYNNEDWSEWSSWQNERVYWIDNGGFSKLLLYPEIYEKYDYRKNDIQLLESWFFADKKLININKLKEMRVELDSISSKSIKFKNIRKSIKFFFSKNLIIYSLLALTSLTLFYSKISLLSFIFAFIGFCYIGYMGRPGEERVYFPVIFGLFLFPVIFNNLQIPIFISSFYNFLIFNFFKIFKFLFLTFIFFSLITNLYFFHNKYLLKSRNLQNELVSLTKLDDYIVVWGASFPYVEALPLNTKYAHIKFPDMYVLGTPTLNPYSFAYISEKNNNGFIIKFTSKKGLYLVSDLNGIRMLDSYCKFNHNGNFTYKRLDGFKSIDIFKVSCLK